PPRSITARLRDTGLDALPDLALRLSDLGLIALARDIATSERRADPDGTGTGGFDVIQIEGLEMAPIGMAAFAAACGADGAAASRAARLAPDRAARLARGTRALDGRARYSRARYSRARDGRARDGRARDGESGPDGPGAPSPRLIYDAHNAEWLLQHRAWMTDARHPSRWHGALYSVAQTLKLRRYERSLMDAADATVAVSEADARALRSLGGRHRIAVVPNGVDTDTYEPESSGARDEGGSSLSGSAPVESGLCVFVGKMDFRPNVDAARWLCSDVWPRVRRAQPAARLAIVGRDPAPAVAALATGDVSVTGAVPDVRPWLERAQVVVVPLRVGGGTRLKVLEAMAMAKPIVATSLAVEGLDVRDGHEVLLADKPADLAAAIARVMDDEQLQRDLGARARAKAEAGYRWDVLVPRIEELYGDAGPRSDDPGCGAGLEGGYTGGLDDPGSNV
ncbi:MAG: glycosyltransferase, partial [Anaerolineae bacterium]